jgi:hypothetical protein
MTIKLFAKQTYKLGFTCAVLACAIAAGKAQNQITYDNASDFNGTVEYWGSYSTATFGESFYAPIAASVSLEDFTFYLSNVTYGEGGNGTIVYQADVYAWNGSQATGTALFSQNSSVTGNGTFQPVTTITGGVNLTSGAEYIAFFTTSDPASLAANTSFAGAYAWEYVGASTPEPNAGGGEFFLNNNQTLSQLTSTTWDAFGGGDLAWKADFNTFPVPEPSTFALASLGTVGLFLFRRYRK